MYYVDGSFEVRDCPRAELERRADGVMNALLDLEEHPGSGFHDASVGVDFGKCRVDIDLYVDVDDLIEAVTIYLTTVRTAIHEIGDSTAGWDEMIDAVRVASTRKVTEDSTDLAGV